LNSSGISSKGKWPAPSIMASSHLGRARLRGPDESTSTALSRLPQIKSDRALIRGIAARKVVTSFSQVRKVFRTLSTLPGRMICEQYPWTVPGGRRRESPYIRTRAVWYSGREKGQTILRKVPPIRPLKNCIRPAPRFDQGFTGATSTRERTLALWAARSMAIAPPQEHPTTSASSSLRRSIREKTRSVCAAIEQSRWRGASLSPWPGRSTA
jgi:hypothetical protein